MFVCLYNVCVCLFVCLSICLSVCFYVGLSVCQPFFMSVCLSVCMRCMYVCLYVCLTNFNLNLISAILKITYLLQIYNINFLTKNTELLVQKRCGGYAIAEEENVSIQGQLTLRHKIEIPILSKPEPVPLAGKLPSGLKYRLSRTTCPKTTA